MSNERKSSYVPKLITLAAPSLLLGAYVAGYFWLGSYLHFGGLRIRTYNHVVFSIAYGPMGQLEQSLTGNEVVINCEVDSNGIAYFP